MKNTTIRYFLTKHFFTIILMFEKINGKAFEENEFTHYFIHETIYLRSKYIWIIG